MHLSIQKWSNPVNPLRQLLDALFNPSGAPHPLSTSGLPTPPGGPAQLPAPIHRKVLMITHNPVLRSQGGRTLKEHFGWQDPDTLAAGYAKDIREISYGYANYEVVDRLVVDGYPLKRDGFCYTEESYLEAWRQRKFHDPDGVDYLELVREFQMIERVSSGEIDEVWLFGPPASPISSGKRAALTGTGGNT